MIGSRLFGRGEVISVMKNVILLVGVVTGVTGDRTFTKVYEPIVGTAACFKRLNGTDEIGCRSSSNGEVGVLHVIEDPVSLKWVLETGPHSPYIAIMYPEYFTRENLLKFKNSKRVNGVLLLPEKKSDDEGDTSLSSTAKKVSSFSTDSSCPNNQFGIYNTSSPKYCPSPKWNPPGNSILYENFDYPIFFVKNDTEADTLTKCYETFNRPLLNGTEPRDWPLCAGQLKSFMMAAKDTPTCIRRSSVFSINPGTTKVCDPLGDQNLWATLLPQNNTSTNTTSNVTKSAIVLAARFDGASLFDEMSPSADTSVTGLVTLLTIVKHLGSLKDKITISPSSPINSIYFMIFNGETFGYIGSSRIAYDMKQGQFPLKFEEIRYFLEINQAAPHGSYYVHQSDIGQSREFTDLLTNQAVLQNLSLSVLQKQESMGVPPSSLHSFLREHPDLVGLVVTNHNQSYTNPYYNSIYDTKENINYAYSDRDVTHIQQRIASLAATISNSVLELLQDGADPESKLTVKPDLDTVDELLHCYLETSNCSIFRAISGFDPSPNSPMAPYPLYVGVATYVNTLTQLTKYIMVSYLGTPVENATSEEICNAGADRTRYFINGKCFDCPQINMTDAKSPAFIIEDYDWSSGKYSTWTESVWQKFSVRIFLKPSLLHELMTLLSGVVILIASFVVVRFVNAKADLIFPSRTDAMVC